MTTNTAAAGRQLLRDSKQRRNLEEPKNGIIKNYRPVEVR